MSEYKFKPWTDPTHSRYCPLVNKRWFKVWNHWLNPLGNWHEPLPFPEKRDDEAPRNQYLKWLYWMARNPFHNCGHFWVGICPLGERYEWISPTERGWRRVLKESFTLYWIKPHHISLPYYETWFGKWQFYIGWKSRGTFAMALRRQR